MARDEPGIPLHRFSAKNLHRMRETGVLAPGARVELLAGILVDVPRPTVREREVTRRIAGILAQHFEADVVSGEPFHPDGYATFDATIMIHDWEHRPLTAPYRLHRFRLADFDRMFELGMLTNADRYELLDGVVLDAQRGAASAAFIVDVAARLPAPASNAIVRLRSAVELGPYSRIWLDVAVCRPRATGYEVRPPTGEEVLLAIDVVSRPELAQLLRWPLYARWGVSIAWIVDQRHDEIRLLQRTPLDAAFTVARHRIADVLDD